VNNNCKLLLQSSPLNLCFGANEQEISKEKKLLLGRRVNGEPDWSFAFG